MISFKKEDNILIIVYTLTSHPEWLFNKFKENESYTLSHTFHLSKKHLIQYLNQDFITALNKKNPNENWDWENLYFNFGSLKEEYYKINRSILNIKNDLYIHKKIELKRKLFVAECRISIFKHIDDLINEAFYIGGRNKNAVSYNDFESLLKKFPNTTEKKKYCSARLSSILAPFFENRKEVKEQYEKYMQKKQSIEGQNLLKYFKEHERHKYKFILKKLKKMLKDENKYNESQWQKEIVEILRLIFPKYIKAFQKVKIKDCYKNTKKELDYLLIDSEGHIDIAEIKRPLDCQVVSKYTYRDNHYPVRELSGTIMQVEKYLLYLNKWGKTGEDCLNKRYENKLPQYFQIKIINPGALIILGRDYNLSPEQKKDFEIVKRKYKNIIDIITYDDLIKRLEFIIFQYDKVE